MTYSKVAVFFLLFLAFVQNNVFAIVAGPSASVDIVGFVPGSTVAFVSEDVGSVVFQITASEDTSIRIFSDDTSDLATAGQDYVAIDETFALATSEVILVPIFINEDDFVEILEFIAINLESNGTLDATQYFLFINDNDQIQVGFEQASYTTTESNSVTICAILINGTIDREQPVTATLTISPGTASPFEDYIPLQPTLSFERGGSTRVCQNISSVPDPIDSPIVEAVEDYIVTFDENPEIEVLSPSNATVYIIDENGADVSLYNPLSGSPFMGVFYFNESDSDNVVEVFVRLNPPLNTMITLQRNVDILLSTSISTADESDFVSVSNASLTIPAGSMMTNFRITIRGDILPEEDEEFTVNISTVNLADRAISPSQAVVVILNDDEVPDCGMPPSPGVGGQVDFNSTLYLSETNYSCNPGHELVGGNATRICLLTGMWSGEDPFCQIIDCGNLTSPLQGLVSIAETTFGSEANYTCVEGYELIGNASRTCLEEGEWSGSDPVCNIVDCGSLYPPPYGNVTHTSTVYQYMATYSCCVGYNLSGNSTRYCQENGLWSGEEPTCEILDCGELESPEFGDVYLNETTFGSVANYSCQTGYILNGTSSRECEEDAQWSDSMPECTPFDCGELLSPPYGQVYVLNGTLYPTGRAVYECDTGYNLEGPMNRSCLFNGWSEMEPVCDIVDCGDLYPPRYGNVTYNSTVYQSTATYSCCVGYNLSGNSTRYCQDSGLWSGEEPSCDIVDCGSLDSPEFGSVSTNETTFGSIANYSCQTGYVVNGTSVRVCEEDGQWSENMPECTLFDCGDLLSPPNGQVLILNGTLYLAGIAMYTCDTGHNLMGPMYRSCLSDGWSGMEPVCQIVMCSGLPNPSNGLVSFDDPPNFGTLANYSCDAGYLLTGISSRVCQDNQRWSDSQPDCLPVDCGNLTDPTNGTVTHLSTTFQSTAQYDCDVRFTLRGGSMLRTCLANGAWSGSQPSCQAVDCGTLSDPVEGSVLIVDGTTFGSTAEYSCNNGFVLIGILMRTCQSNAQWSGSEPTCVISNTAGVGGNRNPDDNNDFLVIVVCSSVGGFSLAVIITVLIITAAIVRSRKKRQESYNFTVTAHRSFVQRPSQIVSESHSGTFIPMRGLDHPLYDSVFANTASTTDIQGFSVPNERVLDTRSVRSNQSYVNSAPSSVVLARQLDNLSQSDTASGRLRNQADMIEAILYSDTMTAGSQNSSQSQLPSKIGLHDDSDSDSEGIPPPMMTDSMVFANSEALESDSVETGKDGGSEYQGGRSDAMDEDESETYNNT